MASGDRERSTRETRERARLYQARQQFHRDRARRRTRDNLIAGIAGGVLILGVVGLQTAYFVAGPGAPAPEPSATSTPLDTPEPTGEATPVPTPEQTPPATPTPAP